MKDSLTARILHDLFEIGVGLKSLTGTLETIVGSLIFASAIGFIKNPLPRLPFTKILITKHDAIAQMVSHYSVSTRQFIGLYILAHGLVNLFIAIQLYREKYWAYKAIIVFLSLFTVYQIYRIIDRHSPFLVLVTLLDIFFIYLTWREYHLHKAKQLSGLDT